MAHVRSRKPAQAAPYVDDAAAPARRDALLADLRALAAAYPGDAAVRAQLAKGLLSTLSDAKSEGALDRRDALLADLRALAASYPDDEAVREQFAKGLFTVMTDAKPEEMRERRDAWRADWQAMAAAYPDDAAVPDFDEIAKAFLAKAAATKKSARDMLRRIGTHNSRGQLTKHYR